MGLYPYADRYSVVRTLPQTGRSRDEILAEIEAMSAVEDAAADEGKISGSIYSGDDLHYAFLNEVFGHYSHANVLQRDMYPSATRFEGEIIAMTADLMHAPEPCGVLTSGGTESLMNPMLVYREWGRERGITNPNVVMPVTAHPALDKGAHYFGIELRKAAVTDQFVADMDSVRSLVDDNTVALVGSAGTYPHGLIDPIERAVDARRRAGHQPPRRRLPRRVHPRLGSGARPSGADVRLPAARCHVDQRRHPQVRLRSEGLERAALPHARSCAASSTSSCPTGPAGCTPRRA